MTAKIKKNQKLVNKVLKYNNLYDINNDLRDLAYDSDDDKLVKKYTRLCEKYFDLYLETMSELPKYEQKNIDKFINN